MNNYNIDKALILFSNFCFPKRRKSKAIFVFSLIESLKIDIDDNGGMWCVH